MYAIKNKATKKWLCGTDYRFYKPRQRMSYTEKLTYETKQDAENDMKKRGCNNYYIVVEV